MDREGEYIEYNSQMCIIVAFDGVHYWLVPEEAVTKANQLFEDGMFIKVTKEDLENSEGLEIE